MHSGETWEIAYWESRAHTQVLKGMHVNADEIYSLSQSRDKVIVCHLLSSFMMLEYIVLSCV